MQIKDHLKLSVEITLRGDPGAVFMLATMRESLFPAQGITTITKANLLRTLHRFDKRQLHHVIRTSRQGERPDEVSTNPAVEHWEHDCLF